MQIFVILFAIVFCLAMQQRQEKVKKLFLFAYTKQRSQLWNLLGMD